MTDPGENIIKMYRQGDLLLKEVVRLPHKLREIKNKILAEGEMSGHAHIIVDGAVYETINMENNQMFAIAGKNTTLIHDEHNPIKLPSGLYHVIRQREYLGHGIINTVVD